MARKKFTKTTRRAALERSQGRCEAIGAWYGLEPGRRCNAPLSAGVEFDHIDLDANSKDNSLSNCAATCIPCHRHKSAKHDTPKAAKTLRQQDKARGVSKPAGNLKSRPSFPQPSKPERQGKDKLPVPERRSIYARIS